MPMIQGARRFSTDPFIDAANQNTSAWQARIQENNLRYGNSGMLAIPQSQSQMPYGQMPMYYGPPQKRPRLTINRGEFGAPPQTGQMGQAAGTQDNPVMQMLAAGQDAMNQANKANLERFNKIMKGYLKRHDKGMDLADARANQAYKEMAGNASQQMVNRGMFNSMEAARKQFDSFEKSRQIPLDQFNRTSADPLLFAERRNDTGPDMGQLLQLAQMAGQSQSGIAGQSSPLSQGVNVGQYPAMQGIQAVQQRQSAPKKMGSPIFAGVMNPYAMMAASGFGPSGGGGGPSPYGLSQRQMQNKANRQAAGGYDALRAQGGQQGQQQQPQQAGQTHVGANAQWWNAPQKPSKKMTYDEYRASFKQNQPQQRPQPQPQPQPPAGVGGMVPHGGGAATQVGDKFTDSANPPAPLQGPWQQQAPAQQQDPWQGVQYDGNVAPFWPPQQPQQPTLSQNLLGQAVGKGTAAGNYGQRANNDWVKSTVNSAVNWMNNNLQGPSLTFDPNQPFPKPVRRPEYKTTAQDLNIDLASLPPAQLRSLASRYPQLGPRWGIYNRISPRELTALQQLLEQSGARWQTPEERYQPPYIPIDGDLDDMPPQ